MQSLRALPRFTAHTTRAFSTTTPRSLARMQIIGNLADAPEAVNTSTGRVLTRFALAVNSGTKDENGNRQTSWFRAATFMEDGPQRELLLGLPKGSKLFIDADAQMNTYQGADGQQRKDLNLLMRTFEVLSRPRDVAADESNAAAAAEPLRGAGAS